MIIINEAWSMRSSGRSSNIAIQVSAILCICTVAQTTIVNACNPRICAQLASNLTQKLQSPPFDNLLRPVGFIIIVFNENLTDFKNFLLFKNGCASSSSDPHLFVDDNLIVHPGQSPSRADFFICAFVCELKSMLCCQNNKHRCNIRQESV